MTVHNLSTFEYTKISLGSSNARIRGELTFTYIPDLAGGTYVEQDDIVVFDCFERRLFKGIVKKVEHTLSSEEVLVTVQSADNFVNCQTWNAVSKWYNKVEQTCETYPIDTTLQEFITAEYVEDVLLWFTSITVAASLQDLIIPEVSTERRGFIDTLEAILSPFPFASWRITFSPLNTYFPVGALEIFDLRDGSGTVHSLEVGQNGFVKNLKVQETIENCAEKVIAFARGKFTERLEILAPNWNPDEEENQVEDIYLNPPKDENDTSHLPEGHEFPQEIRMWVENVEMTSPAGVGSIANTFRVWHGADFKINNETGEIVWLKPEDGADWWWVNKETGQTSTTVSQAILGNLIGTQWRRPVMYNNALLVDGAKVRANYKYIGDRAYRNYKTLLPIANFRLLSVQEEEIDVPSGLPTGATVTRFRRAPTSFDIYIPKVAAQRFRIESREDVQLDERGVMVSPDTDMIDAWDQLFHRYNQLIGNIPESQLEVDKTIPAIKAFMLWPDAETVEEVLQYFTLAQSDASFEEGTNCCVMGQRQLIAIPEWTEHPNGYGGTTLDAVQEATHPPRAGWASWAVLAHYTAWEEDFVEKTNVLGKGRIARAVANSAFSYTNKAAVGLVDNEEVTYENISTYLVDLADDMQEYYGQKDWTGEIEVGIVLDTGGKWKIPYQVGDACSLYGSVSTRLGQFDGIINSINFDNIDSGVVTLSFGRRVPKINPFLPRENVPVDIEGDTQTGPGTAGLDQLGD